MINHALLSRVACCIATKGFFLLLFCLFLKSSFFFFCFSVSVSFSEPLSHSCPFSSSYHGSGLDSSFTSVLHIKSTVQQENEQERDSKNTCVPWNTHHRQPLYNVFTALKNKMGKRIVNMVYSGQQFIKYIIYI